MSKYVIVDKIVFWSYHTEEDAIKKVESILDEPNLSIEWDVCIWKSLSHYDDTYVIYDSNDVVEATSDFDEIQDIANERIIYEEISCDR